LPPDVRSWIESCCISAGIGKRAGRPARRRPEAADKHVYFRNVALRRVMDYLTGFLKIWRTASPIRSNRTVIERTGHRRAGDILHQQSPPRMMM